MTRFTRRRIAALLAGVALVAVSAPASAAAAAGTAADSAAGSPAGTAAGSSDASARASVGAAAAVGPGGRPAAREAAWSWPVGPPAAVLAPFRAPPTPYSAGHRGIDLASSPGDPVFAAADGVVSFAGSVAGRPVLSVDHGDGYVSAIEPAAALVAEGRPVRAGEQIGEVAAGGHCDGRCVHFGVRLHGEYVSPLLLLGGVPRAVLLPVG